jgi:GcrA cell cycle regulator
MGMPAGDWCDEHVTTLRRLWDAGLSASEIAGEFKGAYSRSAILGKVNRLKLAPRRIDNARHPAGAPKPPPIPRKRISAGPPAPAPARTNRTNETVERLRVAAEEAAQMARLEEPSDGKGVKLVDLGNHHCRWPKGDPRNDDFMFCGETTANFSENRPYCPFHTLKSIDRTRLRNPKAFERDAAFAARC